MCNDVNGRFPKQDIDEITFSSSRWECMVWGKGALQFQRVMSEAAFIRMVKNTLDKAELYDM